MARSRSPSLLGRRLSDGRDCDSRGPERMAALYPKRSKSPSIELENHSWQASKNSQKAQPPEGPIHALPRENGPAATLLPICLGLHVHSRSNLSGYLTHMHGSCIFVHMRTTLNIDDQLLKQASKLTGVAEKTQLVRLGLEALVARASAQRLAELGGSEPRLKPIRRRRSS